MIGIMKIKISDILNALEANPKAIKGIRDLRDALMDVVTEWKDANFIQVNIYNNTGNGNIVLKLKEAFPEFDICHDTSEYGPTYIGTNIVMVPADKWNDEVKAKLEKSDSFVGHHEEKVTKYKPKPEFIGKFGLEDKLYPKWDWNVKDHNERFTPVEVVERAWDTELEVYDRRKFASYKRLEGLEIEI